MICEGEKGWLECKQYEVIKITGVYWGRENSKTCPKAPAGLTNKGKCDANAANCKEKVTRQCDKQQVCEVVASNIFFDDNTCGNIYKYLRINFECQPDLVNADDVLREEGKRRRKKKRSAIEKRSFRDS